MSLDLVEVREVGLLRRSGLFDSAWFDERNPDLIAAEVDPLRHFHRQGWREGRWPSAYFDTQWYLAQNQDVAAAEIDPLLHYALYGETEGRRPIEHFEPEWYRVKYGVAAGELCLAHFLRHRIEGWVSPVPEFDPLHYLGQSGDVAAAGLDPFEHYLIIGAAEGREPSSLLDVRYYRARYMSDVPGVNPLVHYRRHRRERGVFATQAAEGAGFPALVRRNTQPGPSFEEVMPLGAAEVRRAKVLAFYLPQFHRVAENDRWWGDGFTEWTNVARGVPRFVGHYQPRVPRDLGHYRLEGTEVLARQIALAKGGGIFGFVFYFYWFNGRRLLDAPLEAFLAAPGLDMPFCLMWANENWTRRWDGSEQEVLLSQDYRAEDEAALVAAFVRHFADARYIRLRGRPVLMVYRAGLIPGGAVTVARWRQLFRLQGCEPVFVMAQSFGERDPRVYGMDVAMEFPPHKLTEDLPQLNADLEWLDYSATARVFDYGAVAGASDLEAAAFPLIRTALPGWDNDARRQGAGMTIHGATPAAYQAWVSHLVDAAVAQPVLGEALVCVNAWNEWAEGAYLEPDVHFGAAFLNATGRAVVSPRLRSGRRVLLVGHDAFPAGAQLLLLHLGEALTGLGVEVRFLLLGGGALEARYRAVAATTVFEGGAEEVGRFAAGLVGAGFRSAIVNTSACGQACAVLAGAGVACTFLLHEMPRLLLERNLVDVARAGVAAARHVVFAAAHVRDRYHEVVAVPEARTALVPQGLYRPVAPGLRGEKRAALRLAEGAGLAVGLGYADLRKGFDLFLGAWRLAQAADATLQFLWVGDLDPVVSAYLGAEIAAAVATGTFHHLPFAIDGADWLAAADVHLLTSREDPFPSVVLEAMSAGVPTVAFEEAGSAPDLLRETRGGVSVPLGDVADMVRQMRVLILQGREEERSRLAGVVRRRFPFAAYAERLLRLAVANPAVSVVIPNFNYGRFLPQRLESVFGQTVAPLEVVVLDDGSTDGSEAVVRRVAEVGGRAVRWVSAAGARGVFAQWRRAAALAVGEFVWIAEADEWAEPGLLEALEGAMREVPDARFGFVDSRAVDGAGRTLWADHREYYRDAGAGVLGQSGVISGLRFLREGLGARNLVVNASAVLWRRSALLAALERAGDAVLGFRVAGDWLLYAQALAEGGSVVFIAEALNVHRRHADAATRRLDPAVHLAEIRRMHAVMRGLLGSPPGLVGDQRRALVAARRGLEVDAGSGLT